jgi:hypothetical protein
MLYMAKSDNKKFMNVAMGNFCLKTDEISNCFMNWSASFIDTILYKYLCFLSQFKVYL